MQKKPVRELLIEKRIPPTEINRFGTEFWRNKFGELHSIGGQPALIFHYKSGEMCQAWWYKNGKHIKRKHYNN